MNEARVRLTNSANALPIGLAGPIAVVGAFPGVDSQRYTLARSRSKAAAVVVVLVVVFGSF